MIGRRKGKYDSFMIYHSTEGYQILWVYKGEPGGAADV